MVSIFKFLSPVFGSNNGTAIKGNGKICASRRDVTGFRKVEATGAVQVVINRSQEFSVTVMGDENILPLIATEMRMNSLIISSEQPYHSKNPTTVTITMPEIKEVSCCGASSLLLNGIDQNAIEIDVAGAGDVTAIGEVRCATLTVGGAGQIKAVGLKSQTVDGQVSGSGKIKAYASQETKLRVSGAGNIIIFGNPKNRTAKVTGAGDITYA